MQPNRNARFGTIPEFVCLAAGVDQGKIALIDNRVEKPCQTHRFPRVVSKFTTPGGNASKTLPNGQNPYLHSGLVRFVLCRGLIGRCIVFGFFGNPFCDFFLNHAVNGSGFGFLVVSDRKSFLGECNSFFRSFAFLGDFRDRQDRVRVGWKLRLRYGPTLALIST